MADLTHKTRWYHPTPSWLILALSRCGMPPLVVGAVSVADVAQGLRSRDRRGCGRHRLHSDGAVAHRRPCFALAVPVQHSVAPCAVCRRRSPMQLADGGNEGGEGTEGRGGRNRGGEIRL